MVLLRLRVRNCYVWGLVILTFEGYFSDVCCFGDSYVWGFVFLCLNVRHSDV